MSEVKALVHHRPSRKKTPATASRMTTGVPGLDDVLNGGLPIGRFYLVQGQPGVGKTTLALEYLLAGAREGEKTLYVTLSETREELLAVADSHGWGLDDIAVHDFSAISQILPPGTEQSVFPRSEMEFGKVLASIIDQVRATGAQRVVIDSLSELRLLAAEPYRFRQQVLGLKHFFAAQRCTAMVLDDLTGTAGDGLDSIAHGVIELSMADAPYGTERRRVRIAKLRGVKPRAGYHDYVIDTGGLVVFPRLVAAEHRHETPVELIKSGIDELDTLVGGGLLRGTSTVLLGPAGTGKSTLALQYACHAADLGKRVAVFLFDEGVKTVYLNASAGRLSSHVASGLIELRQIDPSEVTPGEFTGLVRHVVERGVELVVMDGVTGYLNAMPGDKHLLLQLHEITAFLAERAVSIFLLVTQHGMTGNMASSIDVSFLGDTVLLLRFFEHDGEIKRALSVTKRRGGAHERTIRELFVTPQGVTVGPPLRQFRGLLTGVPIRIEDSNRESPRDPHRLH